MFIYQFVNCRPVRQGTTGLNGNMTNSESNEDLFEVGAELGKHNIYLASYILSKFTFYTTKLGIFPKCSLSLMKHDVWLTSCFTSRNENSINSLN